MIQDLGFRDPVRSLLPARPEAIGEELRQWITLDGKTIRGSCRAIFCHLVEDPTSLLANDTAGLLIVLARLASIDLLILHTSLRYLPAKAPA